jgi:hypothetical protein
MSDAIVRLLVAVVLVGAIWPSAVWAQGNCQFVLGFAELSSRLGPNVVGACIESQWTATGPDTMAFTSGFNMAILPGRPGHSSGALAHSR